jgi:hypothetical protein
LTPEDVGDRRRLHPGDPLDLGDEAHAHLAGPGQADPDRPAKLLLPSA